MFKRANKITALLVAAASVMSVVPAMADTTSSRLGTKDGTIENAIAYKDGKYVYQGYKSDNDTDAIYYNDGSKDKSLDDLSSSDLNTTYTDKYAFANDGSTQYLVDLTSGSVTDSTTPGDDIDTAATKLQTKLNKADRYKSTGFSVNATDNLETANTNAPASEKASTDNSIFAIPGNKFADAWYAYDVKSDTSDASKYVANGDHLYGFTDGSGKYVDASYTANIYAYSTTEGKTVKIDNFSNNYGDVDSDSGLLATLVQQPVALAQDNDYIYALSTVAITDATTTASVTATVAGGTTPTATFSGTAPTAYKTTVRTYIQKIAKAQGDQKDGAYLPKTVESYEVGNATGNEYDCGDAKDAYNAILGAINDGTNASVKNLAEVTQADVTLRSSSNGIAKPLFTINNGNLIAVDLGSNGNSKVDAITLKFKKDKVKFLTYPGYKGATSTTLASGVDKNTKFDAYLLEKDSDSSEDLSTNSNVKGVESYDVDVDGNVWMIADGKIYEYKNASMTQVYTCDSSLDSISVYDANNIVAWEDNGNIYTTVNEGAAQTAADAPAATTAPAATVKTGWDQLTDGSWNFYDATGAKVASKWVNVGGVWYFLKADGVMATGWYNDNGTWYFLKSSGAMATGWVQDGGAWYYLNASGAMLANTTTPDGYFVGSNGAWVQ
jgi:hypothetical protein